MPNDIENIAETLERELLLKRFNKVHLKMEEISGSPINQIIGMGMRTDLASGKVESVSHFYPSYFRNVVSAFEMYPVSKYFGLTIKDAMNLPVDQWYQIRQSARELAEKELPDSNILLVDLIKELIAFRTGQTE